MFFKDSTARILDGDYNFALFEIKIVRKSQRSMCMTIFHDKENKQKDAGYSLTAPAML